MGLLGSMLSGCAMFGMFSTSPTLTVDMNMTQNTNHGKTLAVLVVPMSKSRFIQTGYTEAVSYVGKSQTHMVSLTMENYKDGDYTMTVPMKPGQGVALFALFTSMKADSQWKQYIPDPYGKEYLVNLGQQSMNLS